MIPRLKEILGSDEAKIGIAFYHLVTGEAWRHNDRPFPSASLIKLPIMAACYEEAALGRLALNESQAVTGVGDGTEPFDHLLHAPPHFRFTVRKLLDRMITESDNTSTNALIQRLGIPRIQATIDAWGMTHTRIQREMLDYPSRENGSDNWTTPGDMILFFRRLQESADLPERYRQEMWALLTHQRDRTKLARRLSPDLDLAHKTGELADVCHDAGRFNPEFPFLLAVLTEGLGEVGNTTIGRIAQAVVEHYAPLEKQQKALEEALAYLKSRYDSRQEIVDLAPRWNQGILTLSGSITPGVELDFKDVPSEVRVLAPRKGVVVSPKAPMRRSPAHSAEMVSEALLGTVLDVLETSGDWLRIRTPDGYLGWIRQGGFTMEPEIVEAWEALPAGMVVQPMVWHEGKVLSAGCTLRRGENFWQDPLGNQFPLDTALSQDSLVLSPQRLLQIASQFLGVPYLWGGKSAWGLDCSGLTQMVALLCGIMLPRDADQQQAILTPIPRGELQPGDWVFFPGHVGLYMGDEQVLHASATAARVLIQSLNPRHPQYNSWLDTHLIQGGRPLSL